MRALVSVADVLLCAAAARAVMRRWQHSAFPSPTERVLGGVLVAWLVFFAGFLLPGIVGVATGWPLVRPEIGAAIAAAIALAARRARTRKRHPGSSPRRLLAIWQETGFPARFLVAMTIVVFVLLGALLCLGFPRGFEPRSYHLPLAVHFFRTHGIGLWDREYMDTFPANASLYYGFWLGWMPERLVSASDLPFLALLLVGAYALGRQTGADNSASALSAAGLASIPIVGFSALETGADVGGIAFLALALFFALRAAARGRPAAFLSGAAVGLAVGFKSLHLVSALVLLGIVLRHGARRALPARGEPLARAAWYLAGVALFAGPWLLRSWILLGNPLYPVHLGAVFDWLGWKKAPDIDYLERAATQHEWVRSSAEWIVYPWKEGHIHGENFKHSSGLGAFFAATVPAAVLLSLGALFRGRAERGRVAPLLAGLAAVAAVWFALVDRQPRYLMGALVYASPLVAATIASAKGGSRRALETIAVLAATLMLFVLLTRESADVASRWRAGHGARNAFYEYPAVLDRLAAPATVVNLSDRPDNYGLFGARLANDVINSRRARRELGATPRPGATADAVDLQGEILRRWHASHVFASERTVLRPGPGIRLEEVGRSAARNEPSRILWRLDFAGSDEAPAR